MGQVANQYHLNTGSDTNDVRVEDVETGDVEKKLIKSKILRMSAGVRLYGCHELYDKIVSDFLDDHHESGILDLCKTSPINSFQSEIV